MGTTTTRKPTTWPTYRRWRKTSTKAPEWKKLINRKKPLKARVLFTTREKKTKTRKEAPRKRRLRRTRHKDTDRTRDWKRKRKNRISRIDTRFSSVLLLEEEGFIITFHYF